MRKKNFFIAIQFLRSNHLSSLIKRNIFSFLSILFPRARKQIYYIVINFYFFSFLIHFAFGSLTLSSINPIFDRVKVDH